MVVGQKPQGYAGDAPTMNTGEQWDDGATHREDSMDLTGKVQGRPRARGGGLWRFEGQIGTLNTDSLLINGLQSLLKPNLPGPIPFKRALDFVPWPI